MFSQDQSQEFKETFNIIDQNRDKFKDESQIKFSGAVDLDNSASHKPSTPI